MKQVGSEDGQLDEAELGSPLHKKVPLPRPFSPNGRATNSTGVEKPSRGDGSDSHNGVSTSRRPTVVMLVEDDESLPDHERIKAATLRPRWLRDVLGELPVEEPYPVKEQSLVYDFDRTFSFLFGMAYTWRAPYWFFSMVWAQVVLAICMAVGGHYAQTLHPDTFKIEPDVSKVHGFLGAILSFLIVFRSNAAYDRYYDGRKMLGTACNSVRDLMTELYATLPADPKDTPRIHDIAEHIRRKLNVLMALIRQNARESVAGFCPSSALSQEPFNGDTWYRDPQRPRLYDMITDTERRVYSKYTPGARSQVCACEIKVLISEIAQMAQVPVWVLGRGDRHMEDIMTGEAAMTRIRDTPVPFPYVYIMNVLTFVFIYCTPFIYNADLASKAAATSLLAAAYYGCCAIGLQLENPFGWEAVDLDIELLSMRVHDETRSVAVFALGEDKAANYLPDTLRNLRRATVVEAMRRTMSMALLPPLPTSGPNTPCQSTHGPHT